MEKRGLNELREMFLSYFEGKGHLRLPSFSLVPESDKSLLLINAGMAPLKKFFKGEATPPSLRLTTCQKCIRTPDIERVGKTSRHATYFEMLGNFSFGDYFKHEAIKWSWDFSTNVVGLDPKDIYISVYEEDDETYDIWLNEIGIEKDKIVRLGKEDNFWELGAGPCGPCSELYFDRGEENGCGSPDCKPGCECDRFVEYWNLVFTQFESDGAGNYKELEKKNIDTGMGLERLACIVQSVSNLFEVDTVRNIMQRISEVTGKEYGTDDKTDTSLRVITDHIRSTTFLIADGVVPSNEGRGYVLRRLIRRAARHGRLLGVTGPFLYEVFDCVINENLTAYPYLEEKRELVKKVLLNEEESFERTIDKGLGLLNGIMDEAKGGIIRGDDAFRLADTFGFPLELTVEIAQEKGLAVDEEGFAKLLAEQKQRARNARKNAGEDGWEKAEQSLANLQETERTDHSVLETESKILLIIRDEVNEERAQIVLDKSPFYVESGGQLGDKGRIFSDEFNFEVANASKTQKGVIIHEGRIINGALPRENCVVSVAVDRHLREATAKNHTAAHIVHKALKHVLGDHVSQAGQEVGPDLMRFDFNHFTALSQDEIFTVERLVNEVIMTASPVETELMSLQAAKESGAVALFDEKYGDSVRVVRTGDFSAELCGGTHVKNTGNIGLFKIISESSVAAGVRRIEAVTGFNSIDYLNKLETRLQNLAQTVKGNLTDLEKRVESVMGQIKTLEKEKADLKGKLSRFTAGEILESAEEFEGLKIVTGIIEDSKPNDIRLLCDEIKSKDERTLVVLIGIDTAGESLSFCASCGKEALSKGIHCGLLVKEVSKIAGGSGGGRPDGAMAGAKDISKAKEAFEGIKKEILKQVK
ncbi:MAG TPA: alanine--tRNA ligase [Clostridiales bacterium]|nr:alanine--tRNA ligase [Clostridiales bacterium]